MTVKTTGAEFHAFYNDPAIWPTGVYHEEDEVKVNGSVCDVEDDIAPTDVVTISGGFVATEDGRDMGTFENYFRKWKRKQSKVLFLVECDVSKVDYIKQCVRTAGGAIK